jgi:hypothetical protein
LAKLREQKNLPARESWLSPSGIDNIKTSLLCHMIAAIRTLLVLCWTMVESIQRHAPSQQPTTRQDDEGHDVTIPPQKSHSDKNTIWSQ